MRACMRACVRACVRGRVCACVRRAVLVCVLATYGALVRAWSVRRACACVQHAGVRAYCTRGLVVQYSPLCPIAHYALAIVHCRGCNVQAIKQIKGKHKRWTRAGLQ